MKPLLWLLLAGLLLPVPALAEPPLELLEQVALANRDLQPGLERYQATLKTNKLGQMLGQMTANMPPDMPRPEPPVLRKYWTREGGTLIRAEGAQVFPYMQQMVERFSADLAIDLRTLFLPPDRAGDRARLAATAQVQQSETRVEETRLVTLALTFPAPANLDGAFFGAGLQLPQQGIAALTFDLDPDAGLVRRMELLPSSGMPLIVEARYLRFEQGALPQEIHITTPEGSIHEWLQTTFAPVEGYQLPSYQVRKIRRAIAEEDIEVGVFDYQVNRPFPDSVEALYRK